MYHRSSNEGEKMLAEGKGISLFYDNLSVCKISTKELLHH